MKLRIVSVLAALVLILAITLPVMTSAAPAPPNGKTMTVTNQGDKKGVERHPHIRGAIRELREAKHELETAAHDFGGHRKEAIEAVDNAIKQLQEALEYDKK
jgi:hypothetical protein